METVIISLNEISDKLLSFMGSMLLQSSIIIIVIAAIDLILKSKVKAVIRYGLWMLILLKLVIPPDFALPTGIGYWMPKETQNTETASTIQQPLMPDLEKFKPDTEQPAYNNHEIEFQLLAETENIAPATDNSPSITLKSVIILSWSLLFILGTIFTFKRYRYVKNIIADSHPAKPKLINLMRQYKNELNINRNIDIRITKESQSPSVCGIIKPVILFPLNLSDKLSTIQLKAVLMHELTHVKRYDLLINTIQAILQLIYFFHPLLWFANSRIRKIREQVVDESVMLAMGHEAEYYPTTLLEISRSIIMKPALRLNMIEVVESKSSLIQRIKRIASMPLPKNARLGTAGLTCIIIAAAILLPMAGNSEIVNAKDIETIPESAEKSEEQAQHPEVTSTELAKPEVKITIDEKTEVENNLQLADETSPATLTTKPETSSTGHAMGGGMIMGGAMPGSGMGGGMMMGGAMPGGGMGGGLMMGGAMPGGGMGGGLMGAAQTNFRSEAANSSATADVAEIMPMTELLVPRLLDTRDLIETIQHNKQQEQYDPIIVEIDKKILENELNLREATIMNDNIAISIAKEKLQFLNEQKEIREIKQQQLQQEQAAELEKQYRKMTEAAKVSQESQNKLRDMMVNSQKRKVPPTLTSDSYIITCRILNETKLQLEFEDVSLEEAINQISDKVNVNILVFWNELDLTGVTRDDLVSLKFSKEVSAGKALELALKYVTIDPSRPIGYDVDEEGNVFVKEVGKDHDYEFRTYYIGDLVRPIYTPNYGQNQGSNNNNNNRNNTGNQNNRSRSSGGMRSR